MRPATHSYGLVLLLVAASIVFQMATSGDGSERLVTLLLQAATLVAAVRAAGPRRRFVRAAAAIALLVALVATVTLIVDGKLPEAPAAIVSGLLVAIAPMALAAGLLRDVRSMGVTLHTLAGVLAIYLLLGMFFAFLYGALGAIDASELFANVGAGTPADRLYFSFVTLCTVGYGDIVPAGDTTRTVAVAEMLIGQIYLVTVVAVIVTNLAPRRAA
jgi:Ion channel